VFDVAHIDVGGCRYCCTTARFSAWTERARTWIVSGYYIRSGRVSMLIPHSPSAAARSPTGSMLRAHIRRSVVPLDILHFNSGFGNRLYAQREHYSLTEYRAPDKHHPACCTTTSWISLRLDPFNEPLGGERLALPATPRIIKLDGRHSCHAAMRR
jgi:hypothetical protein